MTMVKFGIQILCVAWLLTVTVSWLECLLLSSYRYTLQHFIMSLASQDIIIFIVATNRMLCNEDVKFYNMSIHEPGGFCAQSKQCMYFYLISVMFHALVYSIPSCFLWRYWFFPRFFRRLRKREEREVSEILNRCQAVALCSCARCIIISWNDGSKRGKNAKFSKLAKDWKEDYER